MASASDKLAVLRTLPTEMHAAILVARLNDVGIDAWLEGGISSGYRAEAPGSANVIVREHDLSRAVSVVKESAYSGAPSTRPRRGQKPRVTTILVLVAWLLLVLLLLAVFGLWPIP